MAAGSTTRRWGGSALAFILGVGALAATPSMAAAPGQERAPLLAAGDVIEGRYVVVMADSADAAARDAVAASAVAAGASVHFTYESALNGFAATLPAAALDAVRSAAGVAYVQPDTLVSVVEDGPTAAALAGVAAGPIWNLDRIDQRSLPLDDTYNPLRRGNGVTAYVIDTGIWFPHPEFEDRASSGYDVVDDDPNAKDCNGHGTHVAGTIVGKKYGVANAAEVVAVRAIDCDGRGPASIVIEGIDWVTEHAKRPAVANLSIGGKPNSALDDAVEGSIAAGIPYAVAAGNESKSACKRSPARTESALTVGGTDKTDRQWKKSNFGTCLDLYAPGVLIRSAYPSDTGITNTVTGTSTAAPHVAGTVAIYLAANPNATPAQVRDAVVGQSTQGELTDLGPKSPNRLVYVDVR